MFGFGQLGKYFWPLTAFNCCLSVWLGCTSDTEESDALKACFEAPRWTCVSVTWTLGMLVMWCSCTAQQLNLSLGAPLLSLLLVLFILPLLGEHAACSCGWPCSTLFRYIRCLLWSRWVGEKPLSLVAKLVFALMMTSSFDYAVCLRLGLLETHLSNFSCGDY